MISFPEIVLILLVMLFVLGPKEMVVVARQTGRLFARCDRLFQSFKHKVMGW
ncbi:MAG: hypothetical protein CMF48_00600 [Legionellales bacterium]|nr:hypothetical protein [Legionellales bacterium]|tara:strand:+ start:448 stop:603 length:156 start_codon:yes stop_codon:yes gene_type:complete